MHQTYDNRLRTQIFLQFIMSTKDQISLTSSDSVALEDIDHDLDQEEYLDESTEHLDPRVYVRIDYYNKISRKWQQTYRFLYARFSIYGTSIIE